MSFLGLSNCLQVWLLIRKHCEHQVRYSLLFYTETTNANSNLPSSRGKELYFNVLYFSCKSGFFALANLI